MYLLLFNVDHSFHISKVELKEEKVYSWGVANESRTILSLIYLKSIVFQYYFWEVIYIYLNWLPSFILPHKPIISLKLRMSFLEETKILDVLKTNDSLDIC